MIVDNVVLSPDWVTGWEREFVPESAVAQVASGAEYVRQRWPYPKRMFIVPYGNMATTDASSPNSPSIPYFSDFYMLRGGNARGFLFWDLYDCYLNNVQIGTGDGTMTAFQVVQPFSDGTNSFNRTIYHPVPLSTPVPGWIQSSAGFNATAPFVVKVNGVLKTYGTDYTVSYTTGLITFATAPGNTLAITVTCLAYTPVRFTDEKLSMTMESIYAKVNPNLIELFYS